jgi:hypothetical protein
MSLREYTQNRTFTSRGEKNEPKEFIHYFIFMLLLIGALRAGRLPGKTKMRRSNVARR